LSARENQVKIKAIIHPEKKSILLSPKMKCNYVGPEQNSL